MGTAGKSTKKTAKKSTKSRKKSGGASAKSGAASTASAKSKSAAETATVDRRAAKDRRKAADRRTKQTPVATERRKVERRVKVNRRRQIDPTTCERDYTSDEIEFMNALDEYKRASGRMFPTCSEILEVVKKLGYAKCPAGDSPDHSIPELTEGTEGETSEANAV